tara:strand:- start:327 stop:1190 length:864 start_codon:yes stop_codon:yes gene_type:complete
MQSELALYDFLTVKDPSEWLEDRPQIIKQVPFTRRDSDGKAIQPLSHTMVRIGKRATTFFYRYGAKEYGIDKIRWQINLGKFQHGTIGVKELVAVELEIENVRFQIALGGNPGLKKQVLLQERKENKLLMKRKTVSKKIVDKPKKKSSKMENSALWRQMKAKGVSVIQLAEKLGIQRQTVYKWIYGSIQISKVRLDQIGEVLDCHPAYLLYADDFLDSQGTQFDSERRFVEIVVEINRQIDILKRKKVAELAPSQIARLSFRAYTRPSESNEATKSYIRENLDLMIA